MNKFIEKVNNGDFDVLINGTAIIGLLVVSMTIANKIFDHAEEVLKRREELGYHIGYKDCADGWMKITKNEFFSKKDKA